jgi:hypothetical protein
MGVVDQGRLEFWKLLWLGLIRYPRVVPMIVRLLVTGAHLRQDIRQYRLATT